MIFKGVVIGMLGAATLFAGTWNNQIHCENESKNEFKVFLNTDAKANFAKLFQNIPTMKDQQSMVLWDAAVLEVVKLGRGLRPSELFRTGVSLYWRRENKAPFKSTKISAKVFRQNQFAYELRFENDKSYFINPIMIAQPFGATASPDINELEIKSVTELDNKKWNVEPMTCTIL